MTNYEVQPDMTREDWLKWRGKGIGSSDVPVIMGVSRFKTYEQLLKEKSTPGDLVEDQSNAYIKARGNKIEPLVRDFYGKEMGLEFTPKVVTDKNAVYKYASLDGIDKGGNLIIEIKLLTTQLKDNINKETVGYKKFIAARDNGKIPVDYFPQIQHQLSVTGLPACIFLGYMETKGIYEPVVTKEDLAIVTVLRDEEYIKKMNEEIDKFWNKVLEERKKYEQNRNTKSA